jgi:hypothetical protein
MRTPTLFVTAILTPVMLCATLLLPSYASIYGASWLIYQPASGPHPLADKYLDVFTMLDTYGNLLDYWRSTDGLGFVDYTLPIVGLPLFGCSLALFLTYKLTRGLLNLFHLSATAH